MRIKTEPRQAGQRGRRATCLLALPLNLALERAPHRGVEAALACTESVAAESEGLRAAMRTVSLHTPELEPRFHSM